MVSWRAYYTEDRDYTSAEHEWISLPDDGVIAVTVYRDGLRGRRVLHGYDWFFHIPNTDVFAGNTDRYHEIVTRYPDAIIKRGKWVGEAEYQAVLDLADSDPPP